MQPTMLSIQGDRITHAHIALVDERLLSMRGSDFEEAGFHAGSGPGLLAEALSISSARPREQALQCEELLQRCESGRTHSGNRCISEVVARGRIVDDCSSACTGLRIDWLPPEIKPKFTWELVAKMP